MNLAPLLYVTVPRPRSVNSTCSSWSPRLLWMEPVPPVSVVITIPYTRMVASTLVYRLCSKLLTAGKLSIICWNSMVPCLKLRQFRDLPCLLMLAKNPGHNLDIRDRRPELRMMKLPMLPLLCLITEKYLVGFCEEIFFEYIFQNPLILQTASPRNELVSLSLVWPKYTKLDCWPPWVVLSWRRKSPLWTAAPLGVRRPDLFLWNARWPDKWAGPWLCCWREWLPVNSK